MRTLQVPCGEVPGALYRELDELSNKCAELPQPRPPGRRALQPALPASLFHCAHHEHACRCLSPAGMAKAICAPPRARRSNYTASSRAT
eukprot:scaffold52223_cov30-Tisochrysis_lutea.AAC.3